MGNDISSVFIRPAALWFCVDSSDSFIILTVFVEEEFKEETLKGCAILPQITQSPQPPRMNKHSHVEEQWNCERKTWQKLFSWLVETNVWWLVQPYLIKKLPRIFFTQTSSVGVLFLWSDLMTSPCVESTCDCLWLVLCGVTLCCCQWWDSLPTTVYQRSMECDVKQKTQSERAMDSNYPSAWESFETTNSYKMASNPNMIGVVLWRCCDWQPP